MDWEKVTELKWIPFFLGLIFLAPLLIYPVGVFVAWLLGIRITPP